MSEDSKLSSVNARGALHRVTRTLKQYLQWQQASGAVGSVPAPAVEREAFEATQKAREQAKLDRLKAGLRGPQKRRVQKEASVGATSSGSAAPSSKPVGAESAKSSGAKASQSRSFTQKPPSANTTAPDIEGASKSTPWKTLGSRPARRFRNASGSEDAPSSSADAPRPEKSDAANPAPEKSVAKSSEPAQSKPSQSTSSSSKTSTSKSAPSQSASTTHDADDEEIYLMDYAEIEAPPDYHPGETLYETRPSSKTTRQGPPKDPSTMSKSEKLEFLRNYMGDCRRCGLCEGRKNVVFGAGNPDARLVFVADAPDATDDQSGNPFSQASVAGTPDALLAKMVGAMGLSLDDVYLCTVVKCRPAADRQPKSAEVKECAPFLFKQLGVIEPEVIVALGGFAAEALSQKKAAFEDVRGQWQSWEKTPVMPTFHPRELLASQGRKQTQLKGVTWQDLQLVMTKLGLN